MGESSASEATAASLRAAPEGASDTRHSAVGWPTVLLVIAGVLVAYAMYRGAAPTLHAVNSGQRLRAAMTIMSLLVWIVAMIGTGHNGRRMRRCAWSLWSANALVYLVTAFYHPVWIDKVSLWYGGGATYFFLPTVVTILMLVELWWSNPAKIAARNARAQH
ncbi:MAG: hypothetical protein SPI12_04320 [Actinomycetaceae bacterium]|nr:hypothetical protein [Actinomycetaceae bacterium]